MQKLTTNPINFKYRNKIFFFFQTYVNVMKRNIKKDKKLLGVAFAD